MNVKIDVYVRSYNEIKLAPFIVKYWQQFAQHVFVFDNESTDGTPEYLSQFDFITVIPYKSNNCFDDRYAEKIRNVLYKLYKSPYRDFVLVCDFDEILYSDNLDEVLTYMIKNNYTYCAPYNYTIISPKFPDHNNGLFLHENEECRFIDPGDDIWVKKDLIWNPNQIIKMNLDGGGHTSRPVGRIINRYNNEDRKLLILHAAYVDFDYTVAKYERNRKRLSEYMVNNNFNTHYNIDSEEFRKKLEDKYYNGYLLTKNDIFKK